ncbi:uncharacterized protein LOC107001303 [Solanum pennellii]|uniref:Uncharacterized protein LOC107001303 n=1 Tax=Solanum pennellii TaxID=28526 RepID=A0ABM1UWQ2_SOLPN|nr:uncharacterized protein LOC107001303 [Solanum pennellii]
MGDERVGELHNDEPSEHELTDSDDMYDGDDDNVYNVPNASVEDQSINYHSTAIPYLDHTDENAEDFMYTRDNGSIRMALWNSNNPKHIQSGMLFMNKMQMKSAVRAYSLAIKKEFRCDQSKSKSWKVICKRHELGASDLQLFMEHAHSNSSDQIVIRIEGDKVLYLRFTQPFAFSTNTLFSVSIYLT